MTEEVSDMDIRRRRGRTPLGSFINDIYFHQTHSHNRHPKLTRLELTRTSLVAQIVKHLPTTWETQVQSLGWEDLLEKEMATHSSILAWKIPWTEEAVRLQSMGSRRVRQDSVTSLSPDPLPQGRIRLVRRDLLRSRNMS